jgi:hypothetical protein
VPLFYTDIFLERLEEIRLLFTHLKKLLISAFF